MPDTMTDRQSLLVRELLATDGLSEPVKQALTGWLGARSRSITDAELEAEITRREEARRTAQRGGPAPHQTAAEARAAEEARRRGTAARPGDTRPAHETQPGYDQPAYERTAAESRAEADRRAEEARRRGEPVHPQAGTDESRRAEEARRRTAEGR